MADLAPLFHVVTREKKSLEHRIDEMGSRRERKNEAQFLYLFGGDYAGMSFLTHSRTERANERCRFLSTTHRDASLF